MEIIWVFHFSLTNPFSHRTFFLFHWWPSLRIHCSSHILWFIKSYTSSNPRSTGRWSNSKNITNGTFRAHSSLRPSYIITNRRFLSQPFGIKVRKPIIWIIISNTAHFRFLIFNIIRTDIHSTLAKFWFLVIKTVLGLSFFQLGRFRG